MNKENSLTEEDKKYLAFLMLYAVDTLCTQIVRVQEFVSRGQPIEAKGVESIKDLRLGADKFVKLFKDLNGNEGK